MDETSKRPRLRGQVLLSRRRKKRRRLTMMTWDDTDFLVSIKVRLDGYLCNALLIFIAPN